MDSLSQLDWSLVQTFLAVSETGSLSEAARQLSLSQPTVGRHVKQMEQALQVTLFTRQPRGLAITEAGRALLPHAQAMRDAMVGLGLAAAGRAETLSGPVRVTASAFTAFYHLPPIIARLRAEEPDITIDLVPSDRAENLLYREADIAVRMFRTEQLDIVTRHITDLESGAYASTAYLDRVGRPETLQDVLKLDLLGFDRNDMILREMRNFGIEAQRDWFRTRCDDFLVYWELLKAGCGVGFVMSSVAENEPGVERIDVGIRTPSLPVWLAAHEAVRHTPRIRRVWDALAEGLLAKLT